MLRIFQTAFKHSDSNCCRQCAFGENVLLVDVSVLSFPCVVQSHLMVTLWILPKSTSWAFVSHIILQLISVSLVVSPDIFSGWIGINKRTNGGLCQQLLTELQDSGWIQNSQRCGAVKGCFKIDVVHCWYDLSCCSEAKSCEVEKDKDKWPGPKCAS